MPMLAGIDESLVDEDDVHHQHNDVVEHGQPALEGGLDAVIEDVDHHVFVLDDVGPHAPEGAEGKEGGVELGDFLPAELETVAHDDGEDDHGRQQGDGHRPDAEIDVENGLAEFFQLFHRAPPPF